MELFPEGGFVRLKSRERGKYVHAEGDWVKVILRPGGAVPTLDSVWRVEHWVSPEQGETFVLLQNAAYGRYLSFSLQKASYGHRGFRTAQLNRIEPAHQVNAHPWTWRVQRLHQPDQDYVTLSYYTCYLRANGKYCIWNNRVTAEPDPEPWTSTMMHWTVHQVAASPVPQALPLTPEYPVGGTSALFPYPPRTILHVRANDEGEFDQNHNNWHSFAFYDSSLYNLRYEVGQLQTDWNGDMSAFTLCMRPGLHGRLMPLVTDLPNSLDTMYIVVFKTGSPAVAALVYPAPPPPPPDAAAA